ncbi:MAG: LamG-like jellyroll fold domain-containing protein [Bryobacteraceae bacterium]
MSIIRRLLPSLLVTIGLASADTFPTGFSTETIATGLSLPTDIAFAAGNRIFISTRSGVVRLVVNGALQAQPFIDISTDVGSISDRGLLGIAVHPNFPATPYVYLLHTYDPPGVAPDGLGARVSRLVRVTADSAQGYNVALANSMVVLLGKNSTFANIGDSTTLENQTLVACQTGAAGTQTYVEDCIASDYDTHSIGMVAFGADGRLYLASGDASSANIADLRALRAQDLDSLNGKILRIDPATGQGLADNPFYNGNPNSNRSKVWSYGLRNPFRFTQHPTTQAIYIGDVGWNDWEEVNTGAGKNFGWPCYEGNSSGSAQQPTYATATATSARCQQLYAQGAAAVQRPLISYSHNGGGAAVILGPVYSGTSYPEAYRNALFYADFNSGNVRVAKLDAAGAVISDTLFGNITATTGMFVGPDTDLYYISYGDGTGAIQHLRFTASGGAPTARISATPVSGQAPLTVNFNGSASSDPENQALTYFWTFGPAGATSTAVNPTYTYTAPGPYIARLTVTDTTGQTGSALINITVGTPPVVAINAPAVGTTYAIGDTISFSGSASDAEDGALSNVIRWTAALHHNDHVHLDVIVLPSAAASGSFVVPDHGQNTYITLCATVVDSSGLSAQACRDLKPRTAAYTFNTSPQGLQLAWDGVSRTAPFTADAIVNSQVDLAAPTPQGCNTFTAWSDGNANAARRLLIGAAATTLTANFNPQCGDPSLVGYWKFDEGAGSSASDASGNGNTATFFNAAWAGGRVGSAASVSGSGNSHVRVPASASLNGFTNQITVSAWAFKNNTQPGWAMVASRQLGTARDNQWYLGFFDGHYAFGVRTANGIDQNVVSAAIAPNGQWVELAGVYDGATMRLFVNGVEAASRAKSGNLAVESKPIVIGGNQNDAVPNSADLLFNGRVDEMRLYRRALSTAEMLALFTSINPVNTPPTVALTAPANDAVFNAPATITLTATASDANGSVARVEFYSGSTKLGEDTTAPYQFVVSNVQPGSYQFTAKAFDNAGASATSAAINVTVRGLIGRWKFDEAFGTNAGDSSGFGKTARLINAGWASGRSGSAVDLSGAFRSHVRIPATAMLNGIANAFTVSAWVRQDANQVGRTSIVTRQYGSSTANSFFLGFNADRYSFRVSTPAGEREILDGTAPNLQWIHVVGTYDGTTMRLFVNGAQVASAAQSGNVLSDGKPILIGGNQNDTFVDNADLLLNGRIDDARIYDRALTSAEVQSLFFGGAQ